MQLSLSSPILRGNISLTLDLHGLCDLLFFAHIAEAINLEKMTVFFWKWSKQPKEHRKRNPFKCHRRDYETNKSACRSFVPDSKPQVTLPTKPSLFSLFVFRKLLFCSDKQWQKYVFFRTKRKVKIIFTYYTCWSVRSSGIRGRRGRTVSSTARACLRGMVLKEEKLLMTQVCSFSARCFVFSWWCVLTILIILTILSISFDNLSHTKGVNAQQAHPQICGMLPDSVGRICPRHFHFSWNVSCAKEPGNAQLYQHLKLSNRYNEAENI